MNLPTPLAPLVRDDIRTTEALWAAVQSDPEKGINNVLRCPYSREYLTIVLAAQALSEAEPRHRLRDAVWWLRPLLLLAGFVLVSGALLALAEHRPSELPGPLGLSQRAVFAGRDLKAASVLRADDVYTAPSVQVDNSIADAAPIVGLALARDIPANQTLRYSDILRPQVRAAQDIPSGTVLSSQLITVTWSAYEPDAATDPSAVTGRAAVRPLQGGKTIRSGDLYTPTIARRSQVVASGPTALPAMHLIQPNEVVTRETPLDAHAFTALDAVVGGFLTSAVAPGAVVRADQLIPRERLIGRQIVSIPLLQLNALGAALQPGDRAAVWFYPRAGSSPATADPVVVQDATVLSLNQHDNSAALTVAALPDDVARVLPLLGKADVFALPVIP